MKILRFAQDDEGLGAKGKAARHSGIVQLALFPGAAPLLCPIHCSRRHSDERSEEEPSSNSTKPYIGASDKGF